MGLSKIKSENAKDILRGKEMELSSALLDRLLLNDERIEGMASGIEDIIKLKDPVGETINGWTTENGLKIIHNMN